MRGKEDARVVIISGNEPLLRLERLRELRALAGDEGLDMVELSGQDARATELLDALSELPFFAERRVVIVRNAERIPKQERESLASGIAGLPSHALLVLVDEPTSEEKSLPKNDPLVAAVKKHGRVEEVAVAKGAGHSEISRRAHELGVEITEDAIEALLEMTSEHITEAVSELAKCALFVGDGGTVTRGVVMEVGTPSREFRVFQLLDAVCAGETGHALATLQDLLVDGKKPEEAALRDVFPLLYRQLRLLFQARLLIERGNRPDVRDCYPKRYSWEDVSSQWQRDKFMRLARSLTLEQIVAMFTRLAQADAELKGVVPALNGKETLERFVVALCALTKPAGSVW